MVLAILLISLILSAGGNILLLGQLNKSEMAKAKRQVEFISVGDLKIRASVASTRAEVGKTFLTLAFGSQHVDLPVPKSVLMRLPVGSQVILKVDSVE